MQKHTNAYYGLMLIGLIYSIPSAPMAYRTWSTKPATTPPRTYATRNSYSKQAALSKIENQPPKQSWWDWFRGRRVEGPATITSPITQPYVVPQAEVPVQPLSTTAQRKPTATRKKPASAQRKPVVKSPVVKSPMASTEPENLSSSSIA